jgi:hypothetical protein
MTTTTTTTKYNHLNMETEGIADPFDATNTLFVREGHPVLDALAAVPRAAAPVHPPRTRNRMPHPHPHPRWFRIHRGVFFAACAFLRGAYEIDEHVATRYPVAPLLVPTPPPTPPPAPRPASSFRRRRRYSI